MSTILIIDDSGFQRRTIRKQLQNNGYTVIEASDGAEGIETALRDSPDFILLDMLMPGITGLETLELMRQKGIKIPVAVVSADIQQTTEKAAMNLGAVGFVKKPVKDEGLANLLNILKSYLA